MLDGENLTLESVERVALGRQEVALEENARKRVIASRQFVEDAVQRREKIYGVTTGLGYMSEVSLEGQQVTQLQNNLIRSHSAGVGEEFPSEICRAMMLLRANTLAKGCSGVRVEIIENLLSLLNAGVTPSIPRQGSVGASGDLVPLAHMALLLTGQGKAYFQGNSLSGSEALQKAGLSALDLGSKEALALVNGTQAMAAVGVMSLLRGERLARTADIIGAMSLEALRGTENAFDERIHEVRAIPGQAVVARNIRRLVAGSSITPSHLNPRVQDAYSLRCIPQVHGAVREVLGFVRRILEIDINSATDNPLIFADDGIVLSGGNFHGEPLAFALDFLAMAISEIANISDRRIARLIDPKLSELPPSLSETAAIGCSFGILQIVSASLVAECKASCHPASVDSIPTAANQEDHVSMGSVSAYKAASVIKNAEQVLVIECLCAAQGMDFVGVESCGKGTSRARELVRSKVARFVGDHAPIFHDEIAKLSGLICDGVLLSDLEELLGTLD